MPSSSKPKPTSNDSKPRCSRIKPQTGIEPPEPTMAAGLPNWACNPSWAAANHGESPSTSKASSAPNSVISQRHPFGVRSKKNCFKASRTCSAFCPAINRQEILAVACAPMTVLAPSPVYPAQSPFTSTVGRDQMRSKTRVPSSPRSVSKPAVAKNAWSSNPRSYHESIRS